MFRHGTLSPRVRSRDASEDMKASTSKYVSWYTHIFLFNNGPSTSYNSLSQDRVTGINALELRIYTFDQWLQS
jgi:hypothetical protein